MEAYCVKCRAKKEMKDPKAVTMKNGKPATQGVCPTCGTKMFRIGKSSWSKTVWIKHKGSFFILDYLRLFFAFPFKVFVAINFFRHSVDTSVKSK